MYGGDGHPRRGASSGWMVVHPRRRGVDCEMVRRGRSSGGWSCGRGVRLGVGDDCMHRGDGHFRLGASSRRCNVVDDLMNRAFGGVAAIAAEAEVDDRMNHAPGEAAVAAEAGVDIQ